MWFLIKMLQTFSQLCAFDYLTKSVQIYKAPWFIQDKPRFKYRGLLIGNSSQYLSLSFCLFIPCAWYVLLLLLPFADTSRHYLPIDVIKQIIESMSFAKLVRKFMLVCSWLHHVWKKKLFGFLILVPTWLCEVERPALAHCRWTILSSWNAYVS